MKMKITEYLESQNVSAGLIHDLEKFRERYPVETETAHRVVIPAMPFYGKEILEMGIAALLQKENLLLAGSKATGKMCWRKIWHGSLDDLPTIYLFM